MDVRPVLPATDLEASLCKRRYPPFCLTDKAGRSIEDSTATIQRNNGRILSVITHINVSSTSEPAAMVSLSVQQREIWPALLDQHISFLADPHMHYRRENPHETNFLSAIARINV